MDLKKEFIHRNIKQETESESYNPETFTASTTNVLKIKFEDVNHETHDQIENALDAMINAGESPQLKECKAIPLPKSIETIHKSFEKQICRLCARLIAGNEIFLYQNNDLEQKINFALPITAGMGDGLPEYICGGCESSLNQLYDFVCQVVDADKTIKARMTVPDVKNSDVTNETIKQIFGADSSELMPETEFVEAANLPAPTIKEALQEKKPNKHYLLPEDDFEKPHKIQKVNQEQIDTEIGNKHSANTQRCQTSLWRIFTAFCKEKKYELLPTTSVPELANILCDFGFNMKKSNGEDYKEYSVKTIWNGAAKMIQRKYFEEYGIKFNPFEDVEFKKARNAKDTLRKTLQLSPEKRKRSADALTIEELNKIIDICDEHTPDGLQKKFFHIASYELAWRAGEAIKCMTYFFKEETRYDGSSNRIIYNPSFRKTCQGGDKKCADNNKWLTENLNNPVRCPVRLYRKLREKRTPNLTNERMFLTPNPYWNKFKESAWFKNMAVGKNEICKWTTSAAKDIGLDVSNRKITNYSKRSLAVSQLAKKGVGEQQPIQINGRSLRPIRIRPDLQINEGHHLNLANELRSTASTVSVQENTLKTNSRNVLPSTPSTNGNTNNVPNTVFQICTIKYETFNAK